MPLPSEICCLVGTLGSGKSSYLAQYCIERLAAGGTVYTNLAFRLEPFVSGLYGSKHKGLVRVLYEDYGWVLQPGQLNMDPPEPVLTTERPHDPHRIEPVRHDMNMNRPRFVSLKYSNAPKPNAPLKGFPQTHPPSSRFVKANELTKSEGPQIQTPGFGSFRKAKAQRSTATPIPAAPAACVLTITHILTRLTLRVGSFVLPQSPEPNRRV